MFSSIYARYREPAESHLGGGTMSPRRVVWPVLLVLFVAVGAASAQSTPTNLDASLTPEERADDLLADMSLEEKVGQMTQINATVLQGDPNNDWDRAELNDEMLQVVLDQNQAGSILSGG